MRRLPLLFGCILVFFASARILLEKKLGNDPRLERTLCRYLLLCSDERLLEKAEEQLTQGGAESLEQAVANLQEALRRNPASADRWCDLGEALLKSGQTEKARTCFSRALELGGESIQIHWRAGEFYFRVNENKAALRCMSRILAHDPKRCQDFSAANTWALVAVQPKLPPWARIISRVAFLNSGK